jgi:hypothetical protein
MDDTMRKAEHYLGQAERVRDMGLKENRAKLRENLLALAENYYLLHDQFAELSRLHVTCKRKSSTN